MNRRCETFLAAFAIIAVTAMFGLIIAAIIAEVAPSHADTPSTTTRPVISSVDSVDETLSLWSTRQFGSVSERVELERKLEEALAWEPNPRFVPELDPEPGVRATMQSVPCEGASRAPDSGDLGHWADRWYVAHDWTEFGRVIASLQIGDIVEVDGCKLRVTGVLERLKTVDAPGVRAMFKTETLLQTCASDDTNFFAVCENAA